MDGRSTGWSPGLVNPRSRLLLCALLLGGCLPDLDAYAIVGATLPNARPSYLAIGE